VFLGPQIFRWYSFTTLKFGLEFEVKKSIRFDLDVQIPEKQMRFDSKGIIFTRFTIFKNNIPLHLLNLTLGGNLENFND
jgi:hypothetical protein